jgi:hypothetical protein
MDPPEQPRIITIMTMKSTTTTKRIATKPRPIPLSNAIKNPNPIDKSLIEKAQVVKIIETPITINFN